MSSLYIACLSLWNLDGYLYPYKNFYFFPFASFAYALNFMGFTPQFLFQAFCAPELSVTAIALRVHVHSLQVDMTMHRANSHESGYGITSTRNGPTMQEQRTWQISERRNPDGDTTITEKMKEMARKH